MIYVLGIYVLRFLRRMQARRDASYAESRITSDRRPSRGSYSGPGAPTRPGWSDEASAWQASPAAQTLVRAYGDASPTGNSPGFQGSPKWVRFPEKWVRFGFVSGAGPEPLSTPRKATRRERKSFSSQRFADRPGRPGRPDSGRISRAPRRRPPSPRILPIPFAYQGLKTKQRRREERGIAKSVNLQNEPNFARGPIADFAGVRPPQAAGENLLITGRAPVHGAGAVDSTLGGLAPVPGLRGGASRRAQRGYERVFPRPGGAIARR